MIYLVALILALSIAHLDVAIAGERIYERYVHFTVDDYVPWHLRMAAKGATPPFTTVEADGLTQVQHLTICRLLGIAPIWLRSFRWGEALSPKGNPLHGTTWFRAVSGPQADVVTMRFDHAGKVVHHSKAPLRRDPRVTGIVLLHDSWVPNTFRGSTVLGLPTTTVDPLDPLPPLNQLRRARD